MKRTEEQQLSQAPIKVKFGEQEYSIPILKIGATRTWRQKLTSELSELFKPLNGQDSEQLASAMTVQFVKYPDAILGLLKAYAPGLTWETIEAQATEEQIVVAYSAVMEVAFPYLAHLATHRVAFGK